MTNPSAPCTILERLEHLEDANRQLQRRCERWKRAGFGGIAFLGLLVIGGAAATSQGTVEGGEFVLRDKSNRMRAALAIRPDGTPGLGLFDETGKVRLSLELNPQGAPGINLLNSTGSLSAVVAIRPDGSPGVGLFDQQGHVRTSLDVGIDGTSGVNVFDSEGTLRAAVAIRPDGTPGVGVFTPDGEVEDAVSTKKPEPAKVAEPGFQ